MRRLRVMEMSLRTPVAASRGARFPVVPGVMMPTEVISARNSNFSVLKLFPAEQAGGVGIEALARDAASLAKSEGIGMYEGFDG